MFVAIHPEVCIRVYRYKHKWIWNTYSIYSIKYHSKIWNNHKKAVSWRGFQKKIFFKTNTVVLLPNPNQIISNSQTRTAFVINNVLKINTYVIWRSVTCMNWIAWCEWLNNSLHHHFFTLQMWPFSLHVSGKYKFCVHRDKLVHMRLKRWAITKEHKNNKL